MYRLTSDLRTGVIEVVIGGFWLDGEIERYHGDLAREVRSVRATGRTQAMLYDYTEAVIQSQQTVASFAAMARDNPLGSRKTAIYTGGLLARRQAGRIAEASEHVRLFDDRADALAWLRA